MNKIFKVIYSKTRHCYVVVSELAKSHCKTAGSHTARNKTALTAAVLLALGTFSVASVFMPMTAEAADKTKTDGSNFVGVERTDGLLDDSKYANYGGKGAGGADSITLGLNAQAGAGTITIGDRNAGASLGSVYVGQGHVANPKLDTGGWVTSIGYNSDATGYGSIALGSNAVAKNSYAEDSKGNSLVYNQTYVEDGVEKVRLVAKPDIQRASVAIGYGASADNGNIAIGSYSDASTDLRATTGDAAKAYLTGKTADSYVSVGKTDALRRISNVADGAADSDVATVGQLQALSDKVGVYDAGFGIKIDPDTAKKTHTISLNRNLGTNYGNPYKGKGKVTFEAGGQNSLILGGAASILFHNEADNVRAGAYGKDSVLVGGFNNLIDTVANDATQTGEYAVIVGGDTNEVTGQRSVSVGGYKNTVTGSQSVINGGASNIASGAASSVFGGQQNTASGLYASVFGGDQNEASEEWSSAIGGITNTASGIHAVTLGGESNVAKGQAATIVGGTQNWAMGKWSLAAGGAENTSYGDSAYTAGGMQNMAFGNVSVALGGMSSSVNGKASTGIAGGSTGENAMYTLAAGYQSVVTDGGVEWRTITPDETNKHNQGMRSWLGFSGIIDYGDGSPSSKVKVLDRISTAVSYQSTADAPGVIAFGHDKGDVASVAKKWKQKATMEVIQNGDNYTQKFYDANHNEISSDEYQKLMNADGTWNDYTQAPVEEKTTYTSSYYNRLVKAADGIDAHDAVVMEQLTPYTKSDASNVGANLKTYTIGDDGETITEAEASADAKNTNENAWGTALGTGKVADPKATGETGAEQNGSKQLVTGGAVFNETRISAKDDQGKDKTYNYLDVKTSAGKNLEALDSALKTVSDSHTALTVEGNLAGTGKDERTKEDVYTGKNILLHESTNATTGKVTYDMKLSKDIVLGDTTYGNGGSLNVYSDTTKGNNLSNHVSINGSTISVNYPKTVEGKTSDARGVILGVGEDSKGDADGYIAFNNSDGHYTYLHSATDAEDNLKDRLEYVGTTNKPKYIANLDDGITFAGDVAGVLFQMASSRLRQSSTQQSM